MYDSVISTPVSLWSVDRQHTHPSPHRNIYAVRSTPFVSSSPNILFLGVCVRGGGGLSFYTRLIYCDINPIPHPHQLLEILKQRSAYYYCSYFLVGWWVNNHHSHSTSYTILCLKSWITFTVCVMTQKKSWITFHHYDKRLESVCRFLGHLTNNIE